MGTIGNVNIGGTTHLIASTAYGYCTDSADTAAKTVTVQQSQGFYRNNGTTVHVYFLNQNTASNPTLNVGGTGAKPIYAYSYDGTNTVKPYWPARSMVSFTYNGSADSNGCWSMNDTANGRMGTYELTYNTTVDTNELKDAYFSKKQIVLKKAGTQSVTSSQLVNYEYDSNDTPTGLVFAEPAQGAIFIYIWDGGWSTTKYDFAPLNHASTDSIYGLGSSSNYGHVKLSDSTSSTSGVSGGIAATPAAIKAIADEIGTMHIDEVTVGASGATKVMDFSSTAGTRGILFFIGYSLNTKGAYIVSCNTSGVVQAQPILAASDLTLTTATRKLTIKNNSTASGAYGIFIRFAGSVTVT